MRIEDGTVSLRQKDTIAQQFIDWKMSMAFANNEVELAQELLNMFIDQLPALKETLAATCQAKDYVLLDQEAHKLLGTTHYVALPRVKVAVMSLSETIKNGEVEIIPSVVKKLIFELDQVLGCYQENHYRTDE